MLLKDFVNPDMIDEGDFSEIQNYNLRSENSVFNGQNKPVSFNEAKN